MAITPKVGQRYHYVDSSQDGILEIISPTSSGRWSIKFLQCLRQGYWKLGETVDFTTSSGTWEYLEGQDRPV